MPAAYHRLFTAEQESGLVTAAVRKTRALRKVRLDTLTGQMQEVDAKTFVARGLGIELTDLEAVGKAYCGYVANFVYEVVKRQLRLSVGGLGGQGVEHFGRSEALVSGLDHQLFFLYHVHEFDTDERPLCCLE